MGFPDNVEDNADRKGRAGLKILTTHTKMPLCEVTDVFTNLTVVITLQYIHIANHCAVHLTLHNVICQLYISKKLVEKKEKHCGHFWEE